MCTNIAHVTHLRACQLTAARAVTFPNVCIAEILEDMDLSFLLQAWPRLSLLTFIWQVPEDAIQCKTYTTVR